MPTIAQSAEQVAAAQDAGEQWQCSWNRSGIFVSRVKDMRGHRKVIVVIVRRAGVVKTDYDLVRRPKTEDQVGANQRGIRNQEVRLSSIIPGIGAVHHI